MLHFVLISQIETAFGGEIFSEMTHGFYARFIDSAFYR